MSITVVIADDQALVRAGFRMILEAEPDIRVVGEAKDGAEAVEAVGVRAAAAAHADVAGLGRPRLLTRRVVEVRLGCCRRATETVGDLPDREALDLAVVPRQGDRPATLDNPAGSGV